MKNMPKEKMQAFPQQMLISVVISLMTTSLIIFLSNTTVFHIYELKSLDFLQKWNRPIDDPKVTLVEINQKSLDALSEQGINWPWPRQIYAPVVDFCSSAGAEAIIFDIIFSEPSSFGLEDDLQLAASISKAGNVFMPVSMSRTEEYHADMQSIDRFAIKDTASGIMCKTAASFIPPIEEFSRVVKGIGDVMVAPDRDGVYRKITPFTRFGGCYVPSLAAAPLIQRISLKNRGFLFDGHQIQTGADGEVMLYYYGKNYHFPVITVLDFISAYQNPDNSSAKALGEAVKGQFIIICLTAPGLYDLKPTPVTSVSPGAYVHATLLTNLLRHHHIRQMDPRLRYALIFLFGLLLGLFIIKAFSFWKNIFLSIVFLVGLPAASFVLFYLYRYWVGFLSYEISALFVVGITSTYRYNTEGKKRRIIRRLFSQYMSEALVRELEADPQKARLGGEKRFITVFFSDLVNFTALAEKLRPEDIVGLLNDYFTEMSQIILHLNGIIDKYQGDGIMAFWGAPIQLQDHAEMACLAALRCQRKMREINDAVQDEKIDALGMRIGLHSGEAIVGNMGSAQRFDYTVVGDNVNLASRLEGVNREYGTDVIISDVTYRLVKHRIEARELDLIAVKGREQPVRIYELLGEKNAISEHEARMKRLFEEGLNFYKRKAFEDARRCFERVLEIRHDDAPSLVFVERCSNYMKSPPPVGWDGVFRLTKK
jgi:adenylate cyclase